MYAIKQQRFHDMNVLLLSDIFPIGKDKFSRRF